MVELNALPFPSSKNLVISRRSRAGSKKKCTKKAWCTCRAVAFCLLTKPIAFWRRRRSFVRSLISNDNGDVKLEGQKSNRLRSVKQQLCTCITLFCTFLCRQCTTTTKKMPNFMFCGRREHQTTTLFFFSWTSMQSFRIHATPQNNCQHLTNWWNKRDQV